MIKEGDALKLLKELDDSSTNCVYFDPPFNTGRVFRLASNSEIGFNDVWETDNDYVNLIEPVLGHEEGCITILSHIGSRDVYPRDALQKTF